MAAPTWPRRAEPPRAAKGPRLPCQCVQEPDVSQSVVAAVERAAHLVGVHIEQAVVAVGVTQAEAHILAELARVGPATVGALHERFGHRRSTLTSVLDRLQGRGYVARQQQPEDRRSLLVSLTPAGREAAGVVVDALDRLERSLRNQVGDRGMREVHRVLEALAGLVR